MGPLGQHARNRRSYHGGNQSHHSLHPIQSSRRAGQVHSDRQAVRGPSRFRQGLLDLKSRYAGQDLNRHEPHTVVWAGVVVEVLTFAQYWDDKRFQGKKPKRPNGSENRLSDNFYKPGNGDLVWVENKVHPQAERPHDTGGKFVLIFSPAWRFGAHGPLMPIEFGLRMSTGRRSDPHVDISDGQWKRLKAWLDRNAGLGGLDVPSGRQCVPRKRAEVQSDRLKQRKTC